MPPIRPTSGRLRSYFTSQLVHGSQSSHPHFGRNLR
jgi:hypothetical protein